MEISGIRHRRQLRDDAVTRRDLERWARRGVITSVQPWYVTADAPEDLVALLRLGVRPACLDAASLHGLWIPRHSGVHAYRPRSRDRIDELRDARVPALRRRDGVPVRSGPPQPVVLHRPEPRAWPDVDPVPELDLVLEHAGYCLPPVKAAVLFESALHQGLLTLPNAQQIVASLPQRARRSLARIRTDAESGTETTVRWWFESRGVPIRAQVPFPGRPQRMDLLVGESWVIECDSRQHHDDPRSYDEDHERDLYLASRGFRVTRLTWEQVFLRWEQTEAMLIAILGRGDHLRPPRAGRGIDPA